MCGIAGIWNLNEKCITDEALESFTNSIAHRGPDGFGFYKNEAKSLGLGHRRLSILDLTEKGKQPMSFSDDRYWITYNGEIFNFIELREELKQIGYSFISDSDTEIILAAYQKWGKDCLYKFNGMWAFAIWDNEEQNLFLARDRFGIKPLYYLNQPNEVFAFASETIAFKSLSGFKREIDNSNLTRALHNPYSLEGYGYTIFKNIYQILPGHYLNVKKGKSLQQIRWWNTLEHLVKVPESYDLQVEKFKEIFENACKIRMRSDVPIASALSGGLDSSAVYCMLHNIMQNDKDKSRMPDNWQRAFVTTFPGSDIDERPYAEQVVNFINGNATYITQDYKELIQKSMQSSVMFDSVFQSPIFVANDIYNAMHNEGIKVSMDGHGVDEMLFGYPHLVKEAYLSAKELANNEYADDIAITYRDMLPISGQKEGYENLLNSFQVKHTSFAKKLYDQLAPEILKKLYRKINQPKRINKIDSSQLWLKNSPKEPLVSLSNKEVDLSKLTSVEQIIYDNFHTTVLPTILRNFDRASMQSGIEIRMPFMDWRLVTYVFSLPITSKIGKGFTKRILRDSIKNIIPEPIRQRKLKMGLGSPLPEWFSGEMKDWIYNIVNSPAFINSEVWNGKLISEFTNEKIKTKSWTWGDCMSIWPYLDAYIISDHNKNQK